VILKYLWTTKAKLTKKSLKELAELKDTWLKRKHELSDEVLTNDRMNQLVSTLGQDDINVCTVIGGILAQDIIRLVSKKGNPIRSLFLMDAENFTGIVNSL
jgi:ubiquitin-like 1-activating enzyme E1 A